MNQKRRLSAKIKKQQIHFSVYLTGTDRWTPPIPKELALRHEVVPPEYARKKRAFLGYTTIFEALAVADHYRGYVLVLYQSQINPLVSQGTERHWFGRFHLYLTNSRTKGVGGGQIWSNDVRPDNLPTNAITYRVIGLYRPTTNYRRDVEEIIQRRREVLPGRLFLRPNPKTSSSMKPRMNMIIRETHEDIVKLLHSQGVFFDGEIKSLRSNVDIAIVSRQQEPTGTASTDRINLASLDAAGKSISVGSDGRIRGGEFYPKYTKGEYDMAGFALLIGEGAVRESFLGLLLIMDHEARHILELHRAKSWVDEWRRGKMSQSVTDFVKEAIRKKRPGYRQSHYQGFLRFVHSPTSQATRAINEMTPYLEGLSLRLIVSNWDSDEQLRHILKIADVAYNYFVDSDPTFDAIVQDWAPRFRTRFKALTSSRQSSVRKLLGKFKEGASGTPFAQFLLAAIDGR